MGEGGVMAVPRPDRRECVVIGPPQYPRDGADAAWLGLVFVLVCAFLVPGAIVGYLWAKQEGALLGVLAQLGLLSFVLVGVSPFIDLALVLDPAGIHFRRIFARTRLFARWSELRQIERVSRDRAMLVATLRFWETITGG